jgi:hypothetical protein
MHKFVGRIAIRGASVSRADDASLQVPPFLKFFTRRSRAEIFRGIGKSRRRDVDSLKFIVTR